MTLKTVPVTGILYNPDGSVSVGTAVVATLTVMDTDGGVVVPTQVSATTDSTGSFTLNLWPNSRGVNGSQYRVRANVPGALPGVLLLNVLITVPDSDPATPVPIATITNRTGPDALSDAKAAMLAAQASALQAATSRAAVAYIYPSVYATAPLVRPDGTAIQAGDRYNNSTDGYGYTYIGGAWKSYEKNTAAAALSVAFLYPSTYATAPALRPDGTAIQNGDRYSNSTDGYEYIRINGVWTNAASSAQAAQASAAASSTSAGQAAGSAGSAAASASLSQTAMNAAMAASKTYVSTAAAMSNGVASLTMGANGSGGTNGTFALAFSGGGGSGAAGQFTVVAGAVVPSSVIVTNPGDSYASTPTVSFAASAGLAGATATAAIAQNRAPGTYFAVPSANTITFYQNQAGVATLLGTWLVPYQDSSSAWSGLQADKNSNFLAGINEQGQLVLMDNTTRGVAQRIDDSRRYALISAGMGLGLAGQAASGALSSELTIQSQYIDSTYAGAAWSSEPFVINKAYGHFASTDTGPPYYPAYRFPTFMQIAPGHVLMFCCELEIPQGIDDTHGARVMVQDVYFDFKSRALTAGAPRVVIDNRAFTSGASIAYAIGPTPVRQRYAHLPNKGRIWCPFASNKDTPATAGASKPYMTYSDDGGVTWSAPTSFAIATGGFDAYAAGASRGIQLKYGANRGRLLLPWYASTSANFTQAFSVYSDDGGNTWLRGTPFGAQNVSEPAFAEHTDGTVYALVRGGTADTTHTQLWKSTDGGVTFTSVNLTYLADPGVQVSMVQASEVTPNTPKFVIAYPNSGTRDHITVGLAYDAFGTRTDKLFDAGNSGYSGVESLGEDYFIAGWEKNYFSNFSADSIFIQAFNTKFITG